MMDRTALAEAVDRLAPWFYAFDFGGGIRTAPKLSPEVAPIHETRQRMMRGAITDHFSSRLSAISAVDVGCHEGWFSLMLADLGIGEILGVDVREENLEKARFVRDALGLDQIEFLRADCEDLAAATGRSFDLTLCAGLLYHLENPLRCLRQIAAVTNEMLLIETQVIRPVTGETEWGRRDATQQYRGAFALIDESVAFEKECPEAGATAFALCPSLDAIMWVLGRLGFARREIVAPPPDGYEQLRRGRRVVIAAYRT